MGYRSRIVGLESSQDFERGREDSYDAIVASKEKILRSRAYTADFVVLEEGPALIVWWVDLADLEEIERFPLQAFSTFPS
jgi:hypothetical protein